MTKSADSSNAMASSTNTVNSNEPSEPFDLERDVPTTEEDIRVLKAINRQPGENLLPYIDELLNPQDLGEFPPRRTTSEGWEPFELD